MRRQAIVSCYCSVRAALVMLIGLTGLASATARASLSHTPLFPHIKVALVDYRASNTEEELEFMASHYDLVIGSLEGHGDSPSFLYTNYYCVYVGFDEYDDMQAWATAHGVDFEAFFIHYAEETEATFGTETHVLPAGSRVPTYLWFGSGGDLTKRGARVVTNPGNPHFRAWKLDYLERKLASLGNDGVFIDNTIFSRIPAPPTVTRGGSIAEYPTNFSSSYWNDLLTLFAEFKAHFGDSKVQVPNVANYRDDPRVYPYVWSIFREAWNQPQKQIWYSGIDVDIAAARTAGVVADVIGTVISEARYEMPALANFYMVMDQTCYFLPYLQYKGVGWGYDPRQNEWFGAVAYDVGQPKGTRQRLLTGIDPSSPVKDTMTATVTKTTSSIYRLTDPTKNWTDQQWRSKYAAFPSGYVMQVYRSGSNWIELYSPAEVPTNGTYQLGTYCEVYMREFDNALVFFRPKRGSSDVSDLSAVEIALPATVDNPSGIYYLLNRDGDLDPTPRTSLSMRNTDGAILVKESKAHGSVMLQKTAAVSGSLVSYTIRWRNTMDTVARAAVIEDLVPERTKYVPGSVEATGGRFDGAKVIWDLGDLAPGATGTVSFQATLE